MTSVWLVARREIRERGKSRAFQISTLISLVIVLAAIILPSLGDDEAPEYDVGVVGTVSQPLRDAIGLSGPLVGARVRVTDVSDRAAAETAVRDGRLDVVLVEGELLVEEVPELTDTGPKARLVAALRERVRLQSGLEQAGLDPQAAADVLRSPPPPVRGVVTPDAVDDASRLTAFYGAILLYILLVQYGYWILMGVVEEKQSRVVEVLLSALRPRQLLAGKVIGLGVMALAQALTLLLTALVTASVVGSNVLDGQSKSAMVWAAAWFVLGYAFYCSAQAAVGSLVSRQEDAYNVSFPIQLPLMVAYFTAVPLAFGGGDPSLFARVLGFFPPTAPIIMPVLVAIDAVSLWQALASVLITLVATFGMIRLAGEIYARAILRTGRRLKLREVLRTPAM